MVKGKVIKLRGWMSDEDIKRYKRRREHSIVIGKSKYFKSDREVKLTIQPITGKGSVKK